MLTLCIAEHEPIRLTEQELKRLALAIKQVVETRQDVNCFLRCDLQQQQQPVQQQLPLDLE
jgi:hypothetical protein